MRVRTTVAAGMLAAAASFPLAGVALANDEGCPDFHSQAEGEAEFHKKVPNGLDGIVCETLGADLAGGKSKDDSVGGDDGGFAHGGKGGDGGSGYGGSADGGDGGDGGSDYGTHKADGVDGKSNGKSKDGSAERADVADGGDDSGPAPVGGVETGAGGTAGDDVELLLPLGLAGGAALAAGGVLVRRRLAGQAD